MSYDLIFLANRDLAKQSIADSRLSDIVQDLDGEIYVENSDYWVEGSRVGFVALHFDLYEPISNTRIQALEKLVQLCTSLGLNIYDPQVGEFFLTPLPKIIDHS